MRLHLALGLAVLFLAFAVAMLPGKSGHPTAPHFELLPMGHLR